MFDVSFREDDSYISTDYATDIFKIISQLAVNLLKKASSKISIKKRHFEAAFNDKFNESVLFFSMRFICTCSA